VKILISVRHRSSRHTTRRRLRSVNQLQQLDGSALASTHSLAASAITSAKLNSKSMTQKLHELINILDRGAHTHCGFVLKIVNYSGNFALQGLALIRISSQKPQSTAKILSLANVIHEIPNTTAGIFNRNF